MNVLLYHPKKENISKSDKKPTDGSITPPYKTTLTQKTQQFFDSCNIRSQMAYNAPSTEIPEVIIWNILCDSSDNTMGEKFMSQTKWLFDSPSQI